MKKVCALFGSANTGKSTVLKIVHAELSKMSSNFDNNHRMHDRDLRDIFSIKGKKVGIETQGDPNSRLGESLKIFRKYPCDLIICATRSRGHTCDLVDDLKKDNYVISWRGQSQVGLKEFRERSNQSIATLLLDEINSLLNS